MNKTEKIEIKIAESKADFEAGKDLFREYSKNLNFDLCSQDFEKDLADDAHFSLSFDKVVFSFEFPCMTSNSILEKELFEI